MCNFKIMLACIFLVTTLVTGCSSGSGKSQQTQPQQTQQQVNNNAGRAEIPAAEAPSQQPDAVKPGQEQTAPSPGTPPVGGQNYSLQEGGIFPPFTLVDLNGNNLASNEIFPVNKVTLVNFWATFCGPCIKEMPEIEELRKQYSGQGLGVVGVLLDFNKAGQARELASRLGTSYPHLLDDGRFGKDIYAVPQTLLVDSSGKVLASVSGARNLQEFSQMVEPYLR